MPNNTPLSETIVTIVMGLLVVGLVIAAVTIHFYDRWMRRRAKPATVKRVVDFVEGTIGDPSLDGPIPFGGQYIFTTVEHGDRVTFSVSAPVSPGERVGLYVPEGGSISDATAFYPF